MPAACPEDLEAEEHLASPESVTDQHGADHEVNLKSCRLQHENVENRINDTDLSILLKTTVTL